MTKQEWMAEGDLVWQRVVLNHYCDCVEHVLQYAPLPEFERAVLLLRQWADNRIDRDTVKTAYREYKKFQRRHAGYTPEGEIGLATDFIFYWSLRKRSSSWGYASYHMQQCTEARGWQRNATVWRTISTLITPNTNGR